MELLLAFAVDSAAANAAAVSGLVFVLVVVALFGVWELLWDPDCAVDDSLDGADALGTAFAFDDVVDNSAAFPFKRADCRVVLFKDVDGGSVASLARVLCCVIDLE